MSQGASTLTMQYVRNVQRDSAETPQQVTDATEQSHGRKLREMRLAVAVEKQMSKEQILEGYLNVAYFGHRAYGIFAAAEVYFSKRPNDLTLAEAAMLAGLVKAPSAYDPASRDQTAALERRNYVLDRMTEIKYLSPERAAQIKAEPIALKLTDPPNDCISVNRAHRDWGYFCDMLKNWWRKQPAFGETPQQREENLRRGGYRIVTSLDPNLQTDRDERGHLEGTDRQFVRTRPGGGPAGHRSDPGRGGQPELQPRPEPQWTALVRRGSARGRHQQLPQHRRPAARPRRHARLPGWIHFQDLHHGGGAGNGSAAQHQDQLAAACSRRSTPRDGPGSCGGRWCPRQRESPR